MHEFFSNWYASVALQVNAEMLAMRWQAVKALSADLEPSDGVSFVQQALMIASNETDTVRYAAREADPTYVSSEDALEIQVLSSGVCLDLMLGDSDAGKVVALTLLSTSFGRSFSDSISRDLLVVAKQHLQSSAEAARTEPSRLPSFPTKELRESLSSLAAVADAPTLQTQMVASIGKVLDSVSEFSTNIQQTLAWLAKLQAEDSDVAYLVVTRASLTGKMPYASFTKVQTAFLAAHDLSELTRFLPLLPTYEAILPVLTKEAKPSKKPISIRSALNELSLDLRQITMSKQSPIATVMPLLFGIAKLHEVDGQDVWATAFDTVTGIKSDSPIDPSALGIQLYIEKMLSKFLANRTQQ